MVARPTRRRMYRTMQGRMVDIEKLRAANEGVRAVGNMGVNARGDVLGPSGQIIRPKEQVMREYYEQPKGKVDDKPFRTKTMTSRRVAPKVQTMTPQAKLEEKTTPVFKPKVESQPAPVTKEDTPKKGIDAALDGID